MMHQIFLFLVFLYIEPKHSSNHLFSSRLHWRNCSLLTSPCFHSRWRGQQHEDSNGILGGSRGHHQGHLHLFTTYLHKYIQNIQIYSTVIAKTQIGAQGENPEERFQDGYHMVKFETQGQNLRNFLRPHTFAEVGHNNRSEPIRSLFGVFGAEIAHFCRKIVTKMHSTNQKFRF